MALSGGVVFAAFGAYFVKTFACRGMVAEFVAFVALDHLELGVIFLRVESLMVDVESAFDAFVGCLWAGQEYHKGKVSCVVFELSSQWFHSHYMNSILFVLMFKLPCNFRVL